MKTIVVIAGVILGACNTAGERLEVRVLPGHYKVAGTRLTAASEIGRAVVAAQPSAVHVEACSDVRTQRLSDVLAEVKRVFSGRTSLNTVECRS